jgi:integrase
VIHKLTPRVVQGAKPLDRPYEIRCSETRGLLLRVQPSGVKSYVVELGRAQRRTIGPAGHITLKQAQTTARRWLSERDEGKLPPAARGKTRPLTLREFVDKFYLPTLPDTTSAKATVANLRAQFGFLFDRKLTDITGWQLDKFKADRVKAGIAPTTVNRDLVRIRSVLSKAVERGNLETNPMRTVKKLKSGDNGRVRFLSAEEEKRLRAAMRAHDKARRERRTSGNAWAHVRGHAERVVWARDQFVDHIEPIVLLALNTGLRRGELFSLTWADVDLCQKTLLVRAQTSKSGRSRRIPLNVEALDVLRRWKLDDATGLVFPGPTGQRMTNINRSWASLVTEAKLKDCRFHDLRHHFASRLVMSGAELYTVKELLGHSDFAMTQRYAHLAPEHKAAAVERIAPKRIAGMRR